MHSLFIFQIHRNRGHRMKVQTNVSKIKNRVSKMLAGFNALNALFSLVYQTNEKFVRKTDFLFASNKQVICGML